MENLRADLSDAQELGVGALLRRAVCRLNAAGIDNSRRDAEVLLQHALGVGREALVGGAHGTIDSRKAELYNRLLQRRLNREPVAYIVGEREFWSLDLQVTGDVLIPRPETELLVEIALELARRRGPGAPLRVLDVGTGSGAIAIALASELVRAEILATDISERALQVARANAECHHLGDRIRFACGDLFGALAADACFDLIVSNPPYIRAGDIAALEPEVSRYEPRLALDGGADGLDFYRRMAAQARRYLDRDGVLLLEIGAGTGATVKQIFQRAGGWSAIAVTDDYAGHERVVTARKVIETH